MTVIPTWTDELEAQFEALYEKRDSGQVLTTEELELLADLRIRKIDYQINSAIKRQADKDDIPFEDYKEQIYRGAAILDERIERDTRLGLVKEYSFDKDGNLIVSDP